MPPPVIEAGPCTLRPFREADIPWVCEVSQDPAIQRNLAEVFAPYRMEHAAYFVRHLALAAWDDGRRAEFLVEEAGTGTRLGRVGLDLRPHDPGAAEIGYWMAPSARGQGVATVAVQVLCEWAFPELGLALIEWHCEVGNVASGRVAEKVGPGSQPLPGAPPEPADPARRPPATSAVPAEWQAPGGHRVRGGRAPGLLDDTLTQEAHIWAASRGCPRSFSASTPQ